MKLKVTLAFLTLTLLTSNSLQTVNELAQAIIDYGNSKNIVNNQDEIDQSGQKVLNLLKTGANVHGDITGNATIPRMIPLHEAVKADSLTITKLLLLTGADVDQKEHVEKRTPLIAAIERYGYDNPEMVQLLLEHHANPNATDDSQQTALHILAGQAYLADSTVVQLLLYHEANIDLKDKWDHTPLEIANAGNAVTIDWNTGQRGPNSGFIQAVDAWKRQQEKQLWQRKKIQYAQMRREELGEKNIGFTFQ